MRQGEIFAVYWSQVDLEAGKIIVDKSLAADWNGKLVRKTPKTKKSRRTIFLPEVTKIALQRLKRKQLREGHEGPWVFPDSEGHPLRKSNFNRREWKPLFEACGVPYFTFHVTRHTGNSILIDAGENALSVSERMGHEDTRMTFDLYGHLFAGAGREAAASMDRGLKAFGITAEALKLDDDVQEDV